MFAMTLGHRFSILCNLERGVPLLEDVVRHYGFARRCASIRPTELTVAQVHDDVDTSVEVFLPEAERAIKQDRAEVICLGYASPVGVRERMEAHLSVPSSRWYLPESPLAESLVRFGYHTSKVRAFKRAEPNTYAW